MDLDRAPAPEETAFMNFCHLREKHDLRAAMLDAVNYYLEYRSVRIGTGTSGRRPHLCAVVDLEVFRDEGAH